MSRSQYYNWIDHDVLLAIAAWHTQSVSPQQIKDFVQEKSTIRLRDAEFIKATNRLREGGWIEKYGHFFRLTPRTERMAPALLSDDADAQQAALTRILR